ncbi:uncharacterized protein VP01_1334g4 [Puccinia sorghi]|uniref:HPP transmembrane region domain-containing protein n=1 Tax=Puccinia sorghi TaxID=27349 RepID=A0A0L6VMF4_9BASI|nr:uncharacterized protein VP01_1334g4 [Puccinia sorghi]
MATRSTTDMQEFSSGYESSDQDEQCPSPGTALDHRTLKKALSSSSLSSSAFHSTTNSASSNSNLSHLESQPSTTTRPKANWVQKISTFDLRPKLPSWFSRFLGYRKDGIHRPIWALRWLDTFNVPMVLEEYLLAVFCTCSGVIGVIAINTTSSFASLPIPLSVGFVGALAITLSLTLDSAAAAPRNVILSHLFSCLLATVVAKLFLGEESEAIAIKAQLHRQTVWCWAVFVTLASVLFQKATGFLHPSAGATALIGTVQPAFIRIGWRYVEFVMTSVLFMLAMALFWGNIGRKSYPRFWFFQPSPPPPPPLPSSSSSAFQHHSSSKNTSQFSRHPHSSSVPPSEGSSVSPHVSKENLASEFHSNPVSSSEKPLSLSIQTS